MSFLAPYLDDHIPVMLPEVLSVLAPQAGEVYVDGTFGAGGYSSAVLQQADCHVIAFDQDLHAITQGQERFAEQPRLTLCHAPFQELQETLARLDVAQIDGLMLDLGVSSMQLDQAERGFSFQKDGPLDMRMDSSGSLPTAAELVNTLEETAIADILWRYGDEKKSRAIARRIVHKRAEAPFTRTQELADVIRSVLGPSRDSRDPATRSFQALRIAVNQELEALEQVLEAALIVLKPGGRLVVVTFHSLEDRIVKQFLVRHTGRTPGPSRHMPLVEVEASLPLLQMAPRKPLSASKAEIANNPRSRSAKLRGAIRTEAAL